MQVTQGWSKKGERCSSKRPIGATETMTVVGAVSIRGAVALHVQRRPMNGMDFLNFLEHQLLPAMSKKNLTCLVLDNLRIHHMKLVKKLCRQWKIKLIYLPPYHPELNPIEHVWSIIKALLRTFAPTDYRSLFDILNIAKNRLKDGVVKKCVCHCMEKLSIKLKW